MTDRARLESILDFLRLADGMKLIERRSYVVGSDRHENDAEHTFHMGLFALLLAPETGLDLDMGRVLELILVHDLVEILAGDTWAYDPVARAEAALREATAAEELFGMLPADRGARLHAAWREFEDGDSPEAHFARAMDRLQAFAQNVAADGRSWHELGVTETMSRDRNRPVMELHEVLAAATEVLYDEARRRRIWPGDGRPPSL